MGKEASVPPDLPPTAAGAGADTHRNQHRLRAVHVGLHELEHVLLEVLVREGSDHGMSVVLLPDDGLQLCLLFLEKRQEHSAQLPGV